MEKRYQIFISSTYIDLKEERKAATEAILALDHFPAGMELFSASDESQFSYIKQVIDASDYYILILAGKYGSVDESGLSYTEKEFDYAVSKGKPILVFEKLINSNEPHKNIEDDSDKKIKLDRFKDKAKKDRMIAFWNNKEDLNSKILKGLLKITKSNPQIGWIRTDEINNSNELSKINKLMEENRELEEKLQLVSKQIEEDEELFSQVNAKDYNEKFTFGVKMINPNNTWQFYVSDFTIQWGRLLVMISDALENVNEKNKFKDEFDRMLIDEIIADTKCCSEDISMLERDFNTIKTNFLISGDLKIIGESIALTQKGRLKAMENRMCMDSFSKIEELEKV